MIGGETPLVDAVAFGQWKAARRPLQHGAKANMWQAAALGLMPELENWLAGAAAPTHDDI